jgi:hypothetical protein
MSILTRRVPQACANVHISGTAVTPAWDGGAFPAGAIRALLKVKPSDAAKLEARERAKKKARRKKKRGK